MALLELTRDRARQGGQVELDRDHADPAPRRAWLVVFGATAGGALASLGVTAPPLRVAGVALATAALALSPSRRLAAVAGFVATALAATGSDQSPDGSVARYVILALAGVAGAVIAAQMTRPGTAKRIAIAVFAATLLAAGTIPSPALPTSGPSELELAGERLPADVADEFDTWIRDQMRARRIPGLAISVTTSQDVLFERGYGVAGVDRRPLGPTTPILLASVSKSFTGLAMAVLADQGRLDLDAPVQRYLPQFRLAPGHESHAAAITVADVPNQTTGLPTIAGINAVGRDETLEEAVAHLATVAPVHPPGTTFEYSNLNYELAGRLIEVASGEDYATFLRHAVLDPLGLHDTTAQADPAEDGLRRSDGYATLLGLMPRRHDRAIAPSGVPAGGISASAADLSRYLRVHLGDGRVDGEQVLPAAVLDLQHHAQPGADVNEGRIYNMGWVLDEDAERIEHGGAWTNTSTSVFFDQDRDLGIAVVVPHMALANPAASKILAGAEAFLDGTEPPSPGAPVTAHAIVDIGVAALIALAVLAVSGIPAWQRRSRRSLWLRVPWVVVSHLAVPATVLIGWPASYGVPWTLQARFLPDLVPVMVASYVTLIVAGLAKLAQLPRPAADTHRKETP